MEKGITRNRILSELSKSPHGKLEEYILTGQSAANEDPEFLARLIAWDHLHGQVRDAKVALPVISMSVPSFPGELVENSLAHMALLRPRPMLKAYRFAMTIKTPGNGRKIDRLVQRYLHNIRDERTIVLHRRVVRELYALSDTKPSPVLDSVLFGASKRFPVKAPIPEGSLFAIVKRLRVMDPKEAAGIIMEKKIPFLVARGALSKTTKDLQENTELGVALIKSMTPTELETNSKMLVRWGIKTIPALRAAYEDALGRTAKSKTTTFKATRAAEAIDDEAISAKLRAVQEKKIQALGGIEGNWLVLGDKSGSMIESIPTAISVAATLARMVKGKVLLVFFDTGPHLILDAAGKTYEDLLEKTRFITANGGTSIGAGLLAAIERKVDIDGIAVVSDAQENTAPFFVQQYHALCQVLGKQIPVYLYRCRIGSYGRDIDLKTSMSQAGLDMQEFDLQGGVDFYSLPNLVQTMRTNRYGLIDEVMNTPLLTLNDVFEKEVA